MQPKNIIKQQNLLDALSHFVTAWAALEAAWSNTNCDLAEGYPFEESFDDLLPEIKQWERISRENIEGEFPIGETDVTPTGLPSGIPSGSVEVYADDLTGKARELAGEYERKLYEGNGDSNEQFAFVIKMAMEGYFVTLCSDGAIDCLYKLPPPVSREDMAQALGLNTVPVAYVDRPDAKHYMVCWMTVREVNGEEVEADHYQPFIDENSETNLKEAKEFYASLLEDEEVYTANLTEILESTDY